MSKRYRVTKLENGEPVEFKASTKFSVGDKVLYGNEVFTIMGEYPNPPAAYRGGPCWWIKADKGTLEGWTSEDTLETVDRDD